jgi:thioredoxin 1
MATVQVTETTFDESVKTGIAVLDWWAPWCGPCRAFAPVFERVSEQTPDVVFGKINTDEEQALAAAFQITAIPTLMIFRDGILLFAQPGVVSADALGQLLQQVKALDMDEVRRKLAEAEAKSETKSESESEEKPTEA